MHKNLIFILITSLLLLNVQIFAQKVYNVESYGAINDGSTVNTVAIQRAIDECSSKGGGKVHFKTGKWLSGTILLKNNVKLSIDSGAVLLGSPDINNYTLVEGFKDGSGSDMGYCFIGAVDAKNIGIEGKGIIDGQGKLVHATGGTTKRPFLLRFVRCTGVIVKDIYLKSPAAWTFNLFQCNNVTVEGIIIKSRGLGNNDGIDIDGCQHVVIKDCNIESGDDAICFKTTGKASCKDILVSRVTVDTDQGAFKFGTESVGDFEDIKVTNCHVVFSKSGGIKLFSVDGSHIHNIEISDIVMDDVSIPIFIRLGARLKTFHPGDTKRETGTLNNVSINNITVVHASVMGILISGIPGYKIDGLHIKNINIHLPGGGISEEAPVRLSEKEAAYPEISMFGKVLPCSGMYIRHVKNIDITNVNLVLAKADKRPVIIGSDIENVQLTNWKLPVNNGDEPLIELESAQNIALKDFKIDGNCKTLLSVEGKDSYNVLLDTNNSGAIKLGDGVLKDTVRKK